MMDSNHNKKSRFIEFYIFRPGNIPAPPGNEGAGYVAPGGICDTGIILKGIFEFTYGDST